MMRNDYATVGACTSSASPNAGQFGESARQAVSRILSEKGAPDVYSKPLEPQSLLSNAFDRLQRVRDGLVDANGRLSGVTTRILGPEPAIPCSQSGAAAGGPPCTADELLDLIRFIALQVERLHEVAGRVERIG